MHLIFRTLFLFLLALSFANTSFSQTTGKKKFVRPEEVEAEKAAKEKDKSEKSHMPSRWGWGINLGSIYFTSNSFQIGLDPNVAYRLQDNLAVGFMLKMNYYHTKDPFSGLKYDAFNFGPTLYTRWRPLLKAEGSTPFLQSLFLQLEYEHAFLSRPLYDDFGNAILNPAKNKILVDTYGQDFLFIGGGIATGYPAGSFVSIHYNLIDDPNPYAAQFIFRVGFTMGY
jgi:hypothetical protein